MDFHLNGFYVKGGIQAFKKSFKHEPYSNFPSMLINNRHRYQEQMNERFIVAYF